MWTTTPMNAPATFRKLNEGWSAEPNAPLPEVVVEGSDLVLSFCLNPTTIAYVR